MTGNAAAPPPAAMPSAWQAYNPFTRDRSRSADAILSLMVMTAVITLPLLLPFARRISPWLLGYITVFALAARLRSSTALVPFTAASRTLAVSFAAILAWGAVSLNWSLWPEMGVKNLLLAGAMLICGLIVHHVRMPQTPLTLQRWLAAGLSVGAAIVLIDLASGGRIIQTFHRHFQTYNYNMVVISYVLMLSALCRPPSGATRLDVALRVAALLAVAAAVVASNSQSAQLAIVSMAMFALVAAVTPHAIFRGLLPILLAAFWLSGLWLGDVAEWVLMQLDSLRPVASFDERISIWQGYAAMAKAGLPLGWGLGSSPAATLTDIYPTLPENLRFGLRAWHPHSNPLEVFVDLGLPGLALAWWISVQSLRVLDLSDRWERARLSAFLAAVLIVALVSHGLWQSWWWATVIIALWVLRLTAPPVSQTVESETASHERASRHA